MSGALDAEVVNPIVGDDEIQQVLSSFAAAHQSADSKPARKTPARKKPDKEEKVEKPAQVQRPLVDTRIAFDTGEEGDMESEIEADGELVGSQFEGMALGDEMEDDDDGSDGLPPASRARRPKPDAGQKDDVWSWYEKFKIGSDPEMDIQIVRVYPKIFPNGVVAEGLLDTCPTPVDAEYIAKTYGGGRYEIHAMGPGKNGHGRRRYSKYTLSIPGVANSAVPSSLAKEAIGKGETRMQAPVVVAPPSENSSVTQQALKTLEKVSDDAQKRARTLEDRMYSGVATGVAEATKLADLVREESDKRIALLREQAEREAKHLKDQAERESKLLEQRLQERDKEIDSLRVEVRQMQNAAPGTLKEIVDMVRPNRPDNAVSQELMNSLLSKHSTETEAMRAAHVREIDATRSAHLREIESLRQSNERDRDSDRRDSVSREQRLADQVDQVREERRRDLEMHRQLQDQREAASKEREQNRVGLVETMWQARMRSTEEAFNFRIQSLSAETERLRGELSDLRSKARDDGDVYSQIEKAKQLLEVARDVGGGLSGDGEPVSAPAMAMPPPPPPPASKGVIDQVMEHGPMIAKIVTDLVGADTRKKARRQPPMPGAMPGAMQPSMPPLGSVVSTPQGRMVVTPTGMVPEQAYLQNVRMQSMQQPRMFQSPQLPGIPTTQVGQGQRPTMQGRGPQGAPMQQPRRMPQQQMSGMPGWGAGSQMARPQPPKRTSRGEHEIPEDFNEEAVDESQDYVVAAPNIFEAEEQMAGAREPLSGTAASFVAKAIDDGMNDAMEVDEFIDAVKQKVPESYLQDLVKHTPQEVIASVREHAPKSLALSPGGLEFTTAVMTRLRAMYGIT